MKRIRKGALGAVLISAGTILAFLGVARPARTAPLSEDATSPSSTMTTGENACYAKGDIWKGSSSDGPAHLPYGRVYAGLDGSPSPVKVISLAAGGDVVGTVKAASCGDTIQLEEGFSFTPNGSPIFPSKNCDSKHWITIRTSAPDSSLPAETLVNTGFLVTGKTATGFIGMNASPAGDKMATPRIDNFQLTNSIRDAGTSGAYPTCSGSDNCAVGEKT